MAAKPPPSLLEARLLCRIIGSSTVTSTGSVHVQPNVALMVFTFFFFFLSKYGELTTKTQSNGILLPINGAGEWPSHVPVASLSGCEKCSRMRLSCSLTELEEAIAEAARFILHKPASRIPDCPIQATIQRFLTLIALR